MSEDKGQVQSKNLRCRTISTAFRWELTEGVVEADRSLDENGDFLLEKEEITKLLIRHMPEQLSVNAGSTSVVVSLTITISG